MTHTIRGNEHKAWIRLLLLIGAPLYLFVNLYTLIGTPFLLGGDQVYFWMYAQRMLYGERVYQDFFQFTPPGTNILFLMLFKVFGPHMWITNAVVLLLGIALCWICFSIAKLLMNQTFALLTAFLFLVLIYARAMNATHHWFSLLAVLCATRLVIQKRRLSRVAAAGTLLGIASCFTQTAGFAVAIALCLSFVTDRLLAKQSWRLILANELLLLTTFGLVCAAVNIFLATRVGAKQLWYFEINYPRHYLTYWFGHWFPGLPEPLSLRTLPHLSGTLFVYALLPVIYPFVLWHSWRQRRNPLPSEEVPEGARLALLSFVGLFLLLEILPGVNWLRLYAISMPGFILLLWALSRTQMQRYVQIAGWILLACIALLQPYSRYRQDNRTIQLPAGTTIVSAQKYETFSWLMQHTKPGDFLFQAAWPGVYLPLGLRNPVFLDGLLANEETRPAFLELSIQELEHKQVKYILWSPRLDGPEDPSHPKEDHLGPFRAYLQSHYARVQIFSDRDEIWQRE